MVVINTDLVIGQTVSTAVEMERTVPCHCLFLYRPTRPVILPTDSVVRPPSFLAQDAPPTALAAAVRRVADGELVMDPRVVFAAITMTESPLTRRELEVLALLADGLPVPEIADRLSLSLGTVRNHLAAANTKTKARNRIDAIRITRAGGWL